MKSTPNIMHIILLAITALALPGATLASGNNKHSHEHQQDDGETAIGKPGVAAGVTRTITVEMNDSMRYTPSDIQVSKGETVRFVVRNSGQLKHELSLGTEQELLEHLEVMKKYPDMVHDEPNKITLTKGQQGEIIWQFTKAGTVNFACLMPGHYEAGMRGTVTVEKK
ncbi:MAG: cupredoxin family protein [Gammaproteobacteria bacterium]|nr:cupredoxin family protein [Gammaproteobacteria bacterium]